MKGTYIFVFDITGTCSISVEAKSPEDAVRKVQKGDNESELGEWDIDFPQNFYSMNTKDAMKYCCDKPKPAEV